MAKAGHGYSCSGNPCHGNDAFVTFQLTTEKALPAKGRKGFVTASGFKPETF
jgi:hypothetical protein